MATNANAEMIQLKVQFTQTELKLYQDMVGTLMYISLRTRPDNIASTS